MAYIILQSRRTRQPLGNIRVDSRWLGRGLIASWNFGDPRRTDYVGGKVYDPVAATIGSGAGGIGLVSASSTSIGTSPILVSNASTLVPTGPCSIVLFHTTGSAEQPHFSVNTPGSDTSECHFYAPFVDGNVYWRYGDGTGISGSYGSVGDAALGFTAGGALGRAIFKNGQKLAGDSSTLTRTASTLPLYLGASAFTRATTRYCLHLFNEQLNDGELSELTLYPWSVYAPDSRRIWFAPSGGGATTERTVAARAKARGAATTATTRTTTAAGRVEARATATTTAIHAGTAAGRIKARGADTVAPLRTESAAGRIRAKATNTVEHIDAGAVSRNVAGKVRARGAAATLAIRATSIVGRVQARGADTVTSTRLSLAAGRVRGRAAVAAAPVIAGMVTTTAAGRLRARGSSTATLTRIEAVAGRVTARGTDTANSIRAAVAAGRLRSRGRATSGPYVAPTLPLEIPPSTRTIDRDPARLGFSPISPTKPRLG